MEKDSISDSREEKKVVKTDDAALQKHIDRLSLAIDKAEHQQALYHKKLRQLPRSPQIKRLVAQKTESEFSRSSSITSILYLKGLQTTPRPMPKSPSSPLTGRSPSMLEHVSELCRISQPFSRRLIKILGEQAGSFCQPAKKDNLFQLSEQDLAGLVSQGLNTQSSSHIRGLLLLSVLEATSVGHVLTTLPPINLGQRAKPLHMLRPLQLATVMWASKAKNRQTLAQLLNQKGLSERSFSRAALALAWHQDPAVHTILPKLFTIERKSPNAIPIELLANIVSNLDDSTTLNRVFRTIYETPTISTNLLSKIERGHLSSKFLATLISDALLKSASNPKAWVHLKDEQLIGAIDWIRILDAQSDSAQTALLLRNLARLNAPIPEKACPRFSGLFSDELQPHTRDALIKVLNDADCLSAERLQAESARGSLSAIIIQGLATSDPAASFLNQLNNNNRERAIRVSEALLPHPKIVESLKPQRLVMKALMRHLITKEGSFALLRLLALITKRAAAEELKAVNEEIVAAMKPYVDGSIGSIHTDALVILERTNSLESIKLIQSVLRGLNEGTTKERLMLRFGHLLGRIGE